MRSRFKNRTTQRRSTRLLAGAASIPIAALVLAGCGGSSQASGPAAPPQTASGRTATVGVENSNLGKILVDSQGRTLYLFEKDMGMQSACLGACTNFWPPLRDSVKPIVGVGTSASKVATIARSDGKPQVTYNGHPLYLFSGDQRPGDTNGQGVTKFGASWFAVSPAGNAVTAQASSSGGSGYSY